MIDGEGRECPLCGRRTLGRHETRWSDIWLCAACGYEETRLCGVPLEDLWAQRLEFPEPNPEAGFPRLSGGAHNAAMYGWLEDLIWELFDAPDYLLARDPGTGWTLLHAAAAGNQAPIARYLLRRGLDPDAADVNGDTALHLAARLGCGDVIEALVDGGASLHLTNGQGLTPLQVATAQRQFRAVRRLRKAEADAGP